MENNKKYLIMALLVLILAIVIIVLIAFNKKDNINTNNSINVNNNNNSISVKNEVEQFQNIEINKNIEENVLTEKEKQELEDLITEQGVTGESKIYEVQEGYNNTKIAVVKPSIKYKVAFAGMINRSAPQLNQLDDVIKSKHPEYAGIWVEETSRDKVLAMIEKYTKSDYKFDENGYLRIENNNEQNDNDKKLENAIKGNKLYILTISSIYYTVDDISGEVLDYNFEKISRGQAYEYFQDNDKYVIFITENSSNTITEEKIIESLIKLI